MDISKMLLTGNVSSPKPLVNAEKIYDATEAKKKQFAKDFESVFINKLFDAMKDTVGDWGPEKDGASEQIGGIFWLYLARDIADNGGFGMWKDIYQSLNDKGQKNIVTKSLDENI